MGRIAVGGRRVLLPFFVLADLRDVGRVVVQADVGHQRDDQPDREDRRRQQDHELPAPFELEVHEVRHHERRLGGRDRQNKEHHQHAGLRGTRSNTTDRAVQTSSATKIAK
ncbi:MAG: hypothetical protein QM811_07475 [Pirellulales bacterium]